MRIGKSNSGKGGMNAARMCALALLAGAIGCGSGTSGSVSGKVTLQGKPVEQGIIGFSSPSAGGASQGQLTEGGAYTLPIPVGGLAPGEYTVVIGPEITYKKVQGKNGSELTGIRTGAEGVPEKYQRTFSSPLRAILTGGDDAFDFDLKP